ncbi:undecaprenyl/decaprenyl-phosphate alpha-N-acetylglucosaminyl 1-phosphate transferase [Natroniella sulfidigena]|uniref:glycosyltransferase family 4 protein n=1 Tax=Natroniella sulfidigena TaxID=723921 RepID=UPI00200ABFD7|nr:MraY family glycosyltransferase [Natroniella sulfidigena]MCK8816400.1 undecaprenyl/decaprenyl-phosphate alpha-N-acetylglucosaminyl 1-phosphate transferase [Natroniella sulfidigena]
MFFYPLLVAGIISLILTPQVKKLAFKVGALDYPNQRRVNKQPIPNLGGLAIYAGVVFTLLLLGYSRDFLAILVSGSLIFGLGILDDLYELSAWNKLIGQIVIALVAIFLGLQIQFITNPWGGVYYLGWLSIPLTLIWLVGITNTINLIDGLDGLAGGITVIAAITLAIFAYQQGQVLTVILTLTVIGSTLGFLRYNFNPAQIFMGDTGSMFLGFMLGVISITGALKSVTALTLIVSILALGIPIFDTLLSIIRRKLAGQPIFQADNNHFHHKLLALGLKQFEVVLIIYLISIFLSMIAIGVSLATIEEALFLLGSAILFLIIGSLDFKKLNSELNLGN